MSLVRAVSLSVVALAFAQVAMAQGAPNATKFTVKVENISKGEVLQLSTGKTAPFVAAPTFWALHTGAGNPIFTGGQPEPGNGLEQLAETGNPEGLIKYVSAISGVAAVGANARPVGATGDGPLTPGQAYEFEVSASPGQTLSLAWMFGQSNDLFYSNERPDRPLRGRQAGERRHDRAALAVGRGHRGERGAGAWPEPGAAAEVARRRHAGEAVHRPRPRSVHAILRRAGYCG